MKAFTSADAQFSAQNQLKSKKLKLNTLICAVSALINRLDHHRKEKMFQRNLSTLDRMALKATAIFLCMATL